MPRLVKYGKTPHPGAIFLKKRVNDPFQNVFMRTPLILGALNPKNRFFPVQKIVFWVHFELVCMQVVSATSGEIW